MKGTYAGLFLTALSALMFEILLTRLFSVATWYYFAFFAISVTMFGLTVGALIVYLYKKWFPDDRLHQRLAAFALAGAVAVDLALLVFLSMPFHPRLTGVGVFSTVFIYLVIALPFTCAGVVVCLCLTRFPGKVARFYAADLVGAAIGAFLVFPVLNAMDAPSAILLVGAIGSLGAISFSTACHDKTLYRRSAVVFIALTTFMLANFMYQPVRVEWVKNRHRLPEDELWNTFSRIAVYPMRVVKKPYSWGLSSAYQPKRPILERMIDIDGVSETPMNYFDGTRESVEHLRYDVTMIAHYLRENAKVFVIGVGGGRDIVAGKVVFNQKKIVGAEINNRILEMTNIRYGDFTGHLDRLPGVEIINDEGRNAITRYPDRFDIIQASCIATWSATSAGAFSLAENTLYTVEAWRTFMDRLEPDGMLSFNRWYSPDYPAQLMRLASLASYTLKQAGVERPGEHIAVVRNRVVDGHMPSGTILVSKAPFSEADIQRLREVSTELEFILEYDPYGPKNELFEQVIDNAGVPDFHAKTMLDLTPPTDDRPFFFYMLRLKDILSGKDLKLNEQRFSLEGIMMLFILLAVSAVLCVAFIFGPLFYVRGQARPASAPAMAGLLFFASIGMGYILVEIGQLQRLIIFLGHPIYSITVVLFSMLLSSGMGALAAGRLMQGRPPSPLLAAVASAAIPLFLLPVILVQPAILAMFEMQGIYARILVSLVFLAPMGFLMGFPFPMGMTIASERLASHAPWFWAINGATSVVASVVSVCISIAWGFTATLSAGLVAYVLAALALGLLKRLSIDKTSARDISSA